MRRQHSARPAARGLSETNHAVIPAGGAGTRLWPRARRRTPKHTLPLASGGRSLLRDTYDRVRGLVDEVFVVTELTQREIINAVLPEVDSDHMIIEPVARGTTNAYGLAALTLHRLAATALMLPMASDHAVKGRAEKYRSRRAPLL